MPINSKNTAKPSTGCSNTLSMRSLTGLVVGAVRTPFALQPDDSEVAEVFEVPLAFLLDPSNHREGGIVADGETRRFHAIPYGDRYIWGVTAGIIRTLYERLYAP